MRYGRRGQRQFGVDLIPIGSDLDIYVQCKHKEHDVLNKNEVLQELQKTNSFPHLIKTFLILTTSARDTSI